MKEKNIKGIIGLCFGPLAIVFAALSMIPMTKLTGMGLNGEVSFFGQINVVFSLCVLVSAVITIIFGAMSKKDADKSAPRKSGVIIGIIFIIIGLIFLVLQVLFLQLQNISTVMAGQVSLQIR